MSDEDTYEGPARVVLYECPSCKGVVEIKVRSPHGMRELNKCKRCGAEHLADVTFTPVVRLAAIPEMTDAKLLRDW